MTEFSQQDMMQIKNHGVCVEDVKKQICQFKSGFPYANIVAPAEIGNGIIEMSADARKNYIDIYNAYKGGHVIYKFVPASGAATRMFKDLFEFLSGGEKSSVVKKTIDNITRFAFYDKLKTFLSVTPNDKDIVSSIITTSGLNYGNLPKGLIAFHKYDNGVVRTALEEHLVEGAMYAASNGVVRIHFTVSPEHRSGFDELLGQVIDEYERMFDVKYIVSMSEQKKSTDTIAVNSDNTVFRNADGTLLFRPAGHGALIENLNEIDADIIFIKNIDNVTNDANRGDTIEYKSALGGLLVDIQQKIFRYLRALDKGCDTCMLGEIHNFITQDLCISCSPDEMSVDLARRILNRPLRVCGVVKNIGAPGGGPFWVKNNDETTGLQIIESSQIAPEMRHVMNDATHFNPVDLVCAVRDYNGNRFDLTKYVDENTGFISEKSKDGCPLRAMERPGLWNGAMADWNTVFVQVPITTFTPVKVVSDLLDDAHNIKNKNIT